MYNFWNGMNADGVQAFRTLVSVALCGAVAVEGLGIVALVVALFKPKKKEKRDDL